VFFKLQHESAEAIKAVEETYTAWREATAEASAALNRLSFSSEAVHEAEMSQVKRGRGEEAEEAPAVDVGSRNAARLRDVADMASFVPNWKKAKPNVAAVAPSPTPPAAGTSPPSRYFAERGSTLNIKVLNPLPRHQFGDSRAQRDGIR